MRTNHIDPETVARVDTAGEKGGDGDGKRGRDPESSECHVRVDNNREQSKDEIGIF